MFRMIENVLSPAELAKLRDIAARAQFVDGKISAMGSTVKNNVRVGDQNAHRQAAQIMIEALYRNEDFRVFAFPKSISQPLLTRYDSGMHYGIHVDSAFMPAGERSLRSDLSCTVFISDDSDYGGGELRISLGSYDVKVKGKAGSAIIYPSTTIHEVESVTSGSRLIGLVFIESRVANTEQRELLSELFEIGAIQAEKMDIATYTRLQRVQENLLRAWGDPD
ncbi:Fe2+-dependent dioxygenase [Sphingomonas sp. G-3-2-10]|nr:Fe2+-dependent dioxygenase [Sphingomonas sp. G-3-2-10]